MQNKTQTATLAGGCFWCLEAIYDSIKGVTSVESGYAGGHTPNPTYKQICTGTTGHAEVVQVTFDPEIITFQDLLNTFFTIHDPTTLNRQGNDIGTQYRSAIFYHNNSQRSKSEEVMSRIEAAGIWSTPIVTEITQFEKFYPAEGYHQDYYARNPQQPYCQVVIAPKVAKFRKQYLERLKG